jgi:murein DD-endopeptidase MepM/ murein hydrolase activator NlpD
MTTGAKKDTGMIFPLQPVHKAKIDTVWADVDYRKDWGIHTGWDINGIQGGNKDLGMPFHCIYPGEVVYVSDDAGGSWGGLIVIWHRALNIYSRYGHHLPNSCLVKAGQPVHAGTMLAQIGRGKNDKFIAHLHFDFLRETPPVSRSGFRPHWSYWSGDDRLGLIRYFLDPTRVFDKFGVITPPIPNDRRAFGDYLGVYSPID